MVELERLGERLHHLRRGIARAALLEPHQVVRRDPCQGGDLLATEAGGSPPWLVGQAGVVGRQAVTPGTQLYSELRGRHDSI